MRVSVQKWGNSLALRIPKSFAEETAIANGSVVDLTVVRGRLVVKPVSKPTYELEELLAGVTKKNQHGEIQTGERVGREAW